MSTNSTSSDSDALITAAGLIWGWLEQGAADQALALVQACVVRWPDQPLLYLLHRQCLVTLNIPWPNETKGPMQHTPQAWRPLIEKLEARRRMHLACDSNSESGVQMH